MKVTISKPVAAGAADKKATPPKLCKHVLVHEIVRVALPSKRYSAVRCTRCSFFQILGLPIT